MLANAIRSARALRAIGGAISVVIGAAACASDTPFERDAPWCVRAAEGCPCEEGAVESCSLPEEDGLCREGVRTCDAGAWSGCGEAPPGAVASVTAALIDDTRDAGLPVPTCTQCSVNCFVAIDDLDPMDGPLDSSNSSGDTVYTDPAGISLFTNPSGYPGDLEIPDVEGDNPPIVISLLPGTTHTEIIDDLPFGIRKLDVYFLVDLNGTMSEELTALVDDIEGTSDYIGTTDCVDADGDGSPDSHGTGLIEAARCFADDVRFGAGFFREVPFAPFARAGEVAYQHLQDISADAALTTAALFGLTVRDLSAFGDAPTSAIVALEALATRDGFNLGLSGPSLAARTNCPAGTRGYPCFRDDAMALVVVLTDSPIHNGPAGNAYPASFPSYPAPATTIDQAAQTAVGTFADPFRLGNVTGTFVQFTGTTSGSSTVAGTTVSCGAADSTADAVHQFTVSGLATGATTPLTLTTEGSAFDTVLSLHNGVARTITPYVANIGNNALTDTEAQGYRLPSSTLNIDAYDLRTLGASTAGRGAEIPSSVMGCLGNDARAPDTVFRFDVAQSGTQLEIDTEGSSFDTVIALFEDHVLPVPTPWRAWVDFEDFFPEGWDQWNRNGDGTLCNGGACNRDWTCDSGSAGDKWCGFYVTGSNPVIDDLDCLDGSVCVIVINAPGQTVLLDHIDVENDSTFYIKVIDAAFIEMDGLNCQDTARCGIDYGPAGTRDVGDSDINCQDRSFCYIRHNNGPLVQVEVYNDAVLQLECGANSQCGDSTYSKCSGDATCILKKAAPSTVNVGMHCNSSASCICLEGSGGATGCRNFCGGSSSAGVCGNANGQAVLSGGGPTTPGVVRRIACDDNGGSDGVRSRITTPALDAGTYYLVVKGKALNRFGAYQLRIRDISGDARLACNNNALATVYHSTLASVPVGNGTYYAVVTGTASGERGAYKLTAGTSVTPITYSPPSYVNTIAALNAQDIRVATVMTCASGAPCTQATNEARTVATDTGASIDPGSGERPMVYAADADGSNVGARAAIGVLDLAAHEQLDVWLRILDEDDDPALDSNPFVTTIAPDNSSLCEGISGSSYVRCAPGERPAFAVTFTNPNPPAEVPDNPADANGAYGFALQLYATTPGTSSPEYVLEEIPVVIVPKTFAGPVAEEGTYTQTLEGRACTMNIRPVWSELVFGANIPLGTAISFQTCATDDEDDLNGCVLQELLGLEAVAICGSGCAAGTVCSSELPDVSPSDVCLRLTSSTVCTVDDDCPVGDSCFNGLCVLPGNWPDISAALPQASLNRIWTRYDIELRANAARTVAPTLDYWHVQYLCGGLN